MATINSIASGDVLTGDNWSGGVVPGPGDTAVLYHDMSLASGTWTVGEVRPADGSNGGTLTVSAGATLNATTIYGGAGGLSGENSNGKTCMVLQGAATVVNVYGGMGGSPSTHEGGAAGGAGIVTDGYAWALTVTTAVYGGLGAAGSDGQYEAPGHSGGNGGTAIVLSGNGQLTLLSGAVLHGGDGGHGGNGYWSSYYPGGHGGAGGDAVLADGGFTGAIVTPGPLSVLAIGGNGGYGGYGGEGSYSDGGDGGQGGAAVLLHNVADEQSWLIDFGAGAVGVPGSPGYESNGGAGGKAGSGLVAPLSYPRTLVVGELVGNAVANDERTGYGVYAGDNCRIFPRGRVWGANNCRIYLSGSRTIPAGYRAEWNPSIYGSVRLLLSSATVQVQGKWANLIPSAQTTSIGSHVVQIASTGQFYTRDDIANLTVQYPTGGGGIASGVASMRCGL